MPKNNKKAKRKGATAATVETDDNFDVMLWLRSWPRTPLLPLPTAAQAASLARLQTPPPPQCNGQQCKLYDDSEFLQCRGGDEIAEGTATQLGGARDEEEGDG